MIKIKHIPCSAVVSLRSYLSNPSMVRDSRSAKNKIMAAKCAQTNLSKSICANLGRLVGPRVALCTKFINAHCNLCTDNY